MKIGFIGLGNTGISTHRQTDPEAKLAELLCDS
jgi:hypothetical protein